MKTLKLDHQLAQEILAGEKTSTWRLFDDKDLRVHDTVGIVDKVDPFKGETWTVIGEATITKVLEVRLADVPHEAYEGHQRYESLQAMLETFQGYYPNQNVNPDTPVKILWFSFRAYKPQKNTIGVQKQSGNDVNISTKIVKLYADGGSRGNPGPSAAGYALLSEDNEIIEQSGVYLGVTTNNQAEYQALKSGLEAALKLQVQEVKVFMDSMLVVNQMKGIFKVKNRDLWPINDSVKALAVKFKRIHFTHIPRELNKVADGEVNRVLDAHLAQVTDANDLNTAEK